MKRVFWLVLCLILIGCGSRDSSTVNCSSEIILTMTPAEYEEMDFEGEGMEVTSVSQLTDGNLIITVEQCTEEETNSTNTDINYERK